MKKLILVAKLAAIIVLSFLLSFIFLEFCSEEYTRAVESYPYDSTALTLSDVAPDKQSDTLDALSSYASDHGLFVVRADQLMSSDGARGTKLGVLGGSGATYPELNFMGADVLDASKLDKLLTSTSNSATLGLSLSQTDMLEDLPSFALGNKLVVEKLRYLCQESGTVNGTYRVSGLAPNQVTELTNLLASVSGTSADTMLNPLSGHAEASIITLILPPIALAAVVLLLALFIASNLFELPELGACMTCGWTRTEFAFEKTYRWVIVSLISLPIAVALGIWQTYGTLASWGFFSFMGGAALFTVLATSFCIIVSSLLVFKVSPGSAIRNRLSRRVLVVVLLCAYIATVAFADFCGFMLDSPVQQMRANAQTMHQWNAVSDLNILEKAGVGHDAASISGQSDRLSQKFYQWYSSIADAQGVYLVHPVPMTQKSLDALRGSDPPCEVPDSPFLTYTASPNYLDSQGLHLDPKLVEAARAGTRVYLLPDTMPKDERNKIESYRRYDDNREGSIPSDIKTAFDSSRAFSFSTYAPGPDLFCWDPDAAHPQTTNDPVICVCTPENMVFQEDMSLWAVGLSNSYLKMTDQAVSSYLTPDYLSRYELADNAPTFVSTREFVAGLQKTLGETVKLFGAVLLLAAVLMLAMVLGFVASYQMAYREEVAAKRLMGHSTWSVYRLPFVVVGIAFCAGLIPVLLLGSQLGVAAAVTLLLLQLVVLMVYVKTSEAKQINRELKE